MKKIINHISIAAISTLLLINMLSCKDFLDARVRTDIPDGKMFKTELNFKEALTGVYVQLSQSALYGKTMTYYLPEFLISNWNVVNSAQKEDAIVKFDYTWSSVRQTIDSAFVSYYGAISSANDILSHIDEKKQIFEGNSYRLIKGEALAIRAILHFELLRAWGPVPGTETEEDVVLPYVTRVTYQATPHIPYSQYCSLILRDLESAESLMESVDPICHYSLADLLLKKGPEDKYWAERPVRINYLTVKAIQARANLWMGNKEAAYNAAMAVINAKDDNGNPTFRLGTSEDCNNNDLCFKREQITGLHNNQMYKLFSENFKDGKIYRKGDLEAIMNDIYNEPASDIRLRYQWKYINGDGFMSNVCQKYYCESGFTTERGIEDYRTFPLVRLAEMYLIATETGFGADAITLWDAFCKARNVTTTALPDTSDEMRIMMMKEYRKEFYAEGQAFFNYKRFNATKSEITWAPASANVNYIWPIPINEIINFN